MRELPSAITILVTLLGLALFSADPCDRFVRPTLAQAGPPQNPDGDDFWRCGDFRFRVTHVIFNHNHATPYGDTEGLALRKNYAATADYTHGRVERGTMTGDVLGEWIHPKLGGRNEPALYVTGKRVTILARIECKDDLDSATFGAREIIGPSGNPDWVNVEESNVGFRQPPGSNYWVSHGAGPNNEYHEFALTGYTRGSLGRFICSWLWNVNKVVQTGQIVQPNNHTHTTTGPHTFYTVLGKPKHPWYWDLHDVGAELTEPWTDALDFLLFKVGLIGETSVETACNMITKYLHGGHRLEYAHATNGASNYLPYIDVRRDLVTGTYATDPVSGSPMSQDNFQFQLSDYVQPARQVVNCYDQAAGVMSLSSLIGGSYWYRYMNRFGYINETVFVGGATSNNPFYLSDVDVVTSLGPPPTIVSYPYDRRPSVGRDDLVQDADGDGDIDRSLFGNHALVLGQPYNDRVWDACIGSKQGVSLSVYLLDCIDTSTQTENAKAGSLANIGTMPGRPWVNLR